MNTGASSSRTGVPNLLAADRYLLSDQWWHQIRNKVHGVAGGAAEGDGASLVVQW